MAGLRTRGEEVRRFILENVEKHHAGINKLTADRFGFTRQAVNKHLRSLVSEGAITETAYTSSTSISNWHSVRGRRPKAYKLAPSTEWMQTYMVSSELAEDVILTDDIGPRLGQHPSNVLDIWNYGITEMVNNAIDHSGGSKLRILLRKNAVNSEIMISDDGVGIFKKIQAALNLLDERHAVLELCKGKLTTDPKRHTGEGIFFTSRMFDSFDIFSGGVYFSHLFGETEDWILEQDAEVFRNGTTVLLKLNNHTARNQKKIFSKYSSGAEDYGFTKTVVPVQLAQYGNDKLISRSQAKRVLARVEVFKTVVFDFARVSIIGQAFADEIFRVFAREHPEIQLVTIKANSVVKRMIERAKMEGEPSLFENLIPTAPQTSSEE